MGPGRTGACAIGFVALLGCQQPPAPIDAPPECPQAFYPEPIAVAATSGTLPVGVRATVRTTDFRGGVAIDIADNKGTVDFDGGGPIPAFIYDRVRYHPRKPRIVCHVRVEAAALGQHLRHTELRLEQPHCPRSALATGFRK